MSEGGATVCGYIHHPPWMERYFWYGTLWKGLYRVSMVSLIAEINIVCFSCSGTFMSQCLYSCLHKTTYPTLNVNDEPGFHSWWHKAHWEITSSNRKLISFRLADGKHCQNLFGRPPRHAQESPVCQLESPWNPSPLKLLCAATSSNLKVSASHRNITPNERLEPWMKGSFPAENFFSFIAFTLPG